MFDRHPLFALVLLPQKLLCVVFLYCASAQFSIASDGASSPAVRGVDSKSTSNAPVASAKDPVAIWLSVFALCASIGFGIYGVRKDSRLRRQSIEDDFWLRKVLGPITIEPVIQKVLEISSKLPQDCSEPGWDAEELKTFGLEYQAAVKELQLRAVALKLLDKRLAEFASAQFEKLEDLILEYCAANVGKRRGVGSAAMHSRISTNAQIEGLLLSVLEAVKEFQLEGKVKR